MQKAAIIALLLIFPLLEANGEPSKIKGITHSKYASQKHTAAHHASTADVSALNVATTHQKRMNTDLKKLESQSNRVQNSRQNSPKSKAITVKTGNLIAGSRKSPAINFQGKAVKSTTSSSSSRSRKRSHVGSAHVGMRMR
jgi:hypothetical protein